jgi:hypothetical protein
MYGISRLGLSQKLHLLQKGRCIRLLSVRDLETCITPMILKKAHLGRK